MSEECCDVCLSDDVSSFVYAHDGDTYLSGGPVTGLGRDFYVSLVINLEADTNNLWEGALLRFEYEGGDQPEVWLKPGLYRFRTEQSVRVLSAVQNFGAAVGDFVVVSAWPTPAHCLSPGEARGSCCG